MPTTTKANLIIPEVIAEIVDTNLGEKLVFGEVTTKDTTLSGRPGDTLKFPSFEYIGAAGDVAENAEVPVVELNSTAKEVTVKKYAKGVQITDEAINSGFGDPMGEAARQLAYAIDHKADNDLHAALKAAPWGRVFPVASLSADEIATALTLYGEDLDGPKILYCLPQDLATLRKDPDYIRPSDIGQERIFNGVVGEIWGCQISVSEKLKADSKAQKSFICKPDALRLVMKESVNVEVEREPKYMRSTVYASEHAAAYLYNEGSVIVLYKPVAVESLDGLGIELYTDGADKKIKVPSNMFAIVPDVTKIRYLLNDSAVPTAVIGTPLVGTTEITATGQVINTAGKDYLHVFVCKADNSPLALTTIPIS
jgi:hypothetical protein